MDSNVFGLVVAGKTDDKSSSGDENINFSITKFLAEKRIIFKKKAYSFSRWIQMQLVWMLLEKPMERKKWNNKKDKKR
jgi:hypothetical protein